jgi:hypothetical protein
VPGWLAVALTALVLGCVYGFSPNFAPQESGPEAMPYGGDFLQEWLGGYMLRNGLTERFYDVEYAKELQFDPDVVGAQLDTDFYLPVVYPPFWYLMVSPLAALPLTAAANLWAGLMIACLLGAVALAWPLSRGLLAAPGRADPPPADTTHSDPAPAWRRHLIWALPIATLYGPTLRSLVSSQKATLALLLLAAAYVLLQRRRPFLAGAVFALLAFKPQLTLVIALAMLCKRQWSFVAGGLAMGGLLLLLSLAVGTGVCRQYVDFSLGTAAYVHTAGYDLSHAHGLYAFFTALLPGAPGAAQGATLAVALVVIALLARLLRGPLRPESQHFALQYAGLLVATVLLSPHVYTYDLTVLLLPLGIVLFATRAGAFRATPRATAALLAATLLYPLPLLAPAIEELTRVQLTVPAMLGLLAAVAALLSGPTTRPTCVPSRRRPPRAPA